MTRQITGSVIYDRSPNLCTIRVLNFFGRKNIDFEVYDLNDNAQVGDFVIARELIIPIKGKDWRIVQIVERAKTSTLDDS